MNDADAAQKTRTILHGFFRAVESRNLDAIGACFAPDATYRNVPHPPAEGPVAIREMFARIVTVSERIIWDVLSEAYEGNRGHVERLDRFWIAGREYAVPCHCVALLDLTSSRILEFRDYLDIGQWKASLETVFGAPGLQITQVENS